MLETWPTDRIAAADFADMSDALERGRIVHFDSCPFPLPADADLHALRTRLPERLGLKNVSFHPEARRVVGLKRDADLAGLAERTLVAHATQLEAFLGRAIPSMTPGWTIGTTSFRPVEEKGRDLSAHASNELIHVDAGAYGATNGDRILRFFVNVNPSEDRVWATRGTFGELYARYGHAAGVVASESSERPLAKRLPDHLRSGALRGLQRVGLPLARALDSSPYDRAMRRFHNYMKDDPDFRDSREGYREFRFSPGSAWMVLTDSVSHACLSGQHALVSTFLIPLTNCRLPELAPFHVLGGSGKRPVNGT